MILARGVGGMNLPPPHPKKNFALRFIGLKNSPLYHCAFPCMVVKNNILVSEYGCHQILKKRFQSFKLTSYRVTECGLWVY